MQIYTTIDPVPQTPIEINEIGPTIQQGMIQRPVQRNTQATGVRPRRSMPLINTQQTASLPNLQIAENGGIRERSGCRNRKVTQIIMITYLTVSTKTDHLH